MVKNLRARIFDNSFYLLKSAYTIPQIPDYDLEQIILFGRSNVGKSSLLNSLCSNKELAKTSKNPGRTEAINFFTNRNKDFCLVDLPGYGFNQVNKKLSKGWESLILNYLENNSKIIRALILVDIRRGLMDSDRQMIALFSELKIEFQIILTKSDKVATKEISKKLEIIEAELKNKEFFSEPIFITSSHKKLGIKEIQKYLTKVLRNEDS